MFDKQRLERRLDRVERKLDMLIAYLGLPDEAGEIPGATELTTEPPARPAPPRQLPIDRPIQGTYGAGEIAEVDLLLEQGKKIAAIKRYRELHPRASLREAKDAVEAREGRLP